MCMFSYATARESTPNIKVNRSKSSGEASVQKTFWKKLSKGKYKIKWIQSKKFTIE